MATRRLNLLLLITLVGILALSRLLIRDPTRPTPVVISGMIEPVTYGAFAANPNFPDGKTLRKPVPGTIRRDLPPLHYRPTAEDAARAGEELQSPLDLDDADVLERGARVFANFCQVCHGPQGEGDGPVGQRGVPPPPSLRTGKSKDMKDGQLFHILTYGQGNMASYASQLSREDRWRVIAHVRSLQQASPDDGKQPASTAVGEQPDTPADNKEPGQP